MELCIDRLTKQYENKIAVDRVSLQLTNGVYGLLGANGAGKTTFMRMLCGILKPTGGTVTFDGLDVSSEEYRAELGYLPQDFGYYPDFSGWDFLMYMASLKGLTKLEAKRKAKELLELVSLSDVGKKKIATYSGGMKQRLGIAQALLNDPKIIILDEPTAGLDPKERIRIRNLISDLSGDKIVLIATHVVSDIEFISKEILLMKNGKVVDKDCPEALQKKIAGKVFEIRISQDELNQVKQEFEISNLFRTDGEIVVRVISEQRPEKYRWTEVSPTLEDVYLYEFECLCRDA